MTDQDLTRIAAFVAGEGTPEERSETERWLAADPELHRLFLMLSAGFNRSRAPEPELDVDRVWDQLQRRRAARKTPQIAPRPARPAPRISNPGFTRALPPTRSMGWMRTAAILVVVSAAGIYGVSHRVNPTPKLETPRLAREIATTRSQRAQVRLADGSNVTLNAESKLRISADFGAPGVKRELYLEGEAYFDVVHDTTAFLVHTVRGVVRDIGTKFSVRAYANAPAMDLKVVVAEGVVALSAVAGRDTLLLRATDAGRVTSAGNLRIEHGVDVASQLGWTEGRLTFKDTPLREVVQDLARWYDIDVSVETAIAGYPISATLRQERVDEALDAIARIVDARIERRGSQYLIARSVAPASPDSSTSR